MKFVPALVLASAAAFLVGAGVLVSALDDSATKYCGGHEYLVGDGTCDDLANNAKCGYDGGDCCDCDQELSTCIDPDACRVETAASTCDDETSGDGTCDSSNNSDECGYDGGDCCECDCMAHSDTAIVALCGEENRYACIDPDSTCVDDDDIDGSTTVLACDLDAIGDGICDRDNNDATCEYDGGDCCECDCEDNTDADAAERCGEERYDCIDPDSTCTSVCVFDSWRADGDCDMSNNTEECGYDGGDCCQCDCVDGDYFECGDSGYACIDESSSCVDDDDYNPDAGNTCFEAYKSDGMCDDYNNNAFCDYDGGDCCFTTCVDSTYTCGTWGYDCLDPSAAMSWFRHTNSRASVAIGMMMTMAISAAASAW